MCIRDSPNTLPPYLRKSGDSDSGFVKLNRVSCFNYAPGFLQLIVNAQQHFRNVAQFGQFSPAALTPSLWLSRLPLWKQSRPWHLRGKPGQGLAVVRIHWLAVIARRFEIGNAMQSGVELACGEIGGIAVAPGQAAPFAAFFASRIGFRRLFRSGLAG